MTAIAPNTNITRWKADRAVAAAPPSPTISRVAPCPVCGGPRVRPPRPSIQARALEMLTQDLAGVPENCWLFFENLFICGEDVTSIKQLARLLDISSSTLSSRFYRAGVPSPKRYLAYARFVRAASLLEKRERSIGWVAAELHASSPQSFNRSIRLALGVTALEFRRQYDGDGMLERFRDELIRPYLAALRKLLPLLPTHAGSPR